MIYLIITTCINTKYYIHNNENRLHKYVDSIKKTLSFVPETITPIIVENSSSGNSYFDTIGCKVHYTNNNSKECIHKGVNELLDIKDVIETYKIQEEDVIIKLTGRYHPINSEFFDLILRTHHTFDAYVKFFNVCTLCFHDYDCVLGMYAIKCKYLNTFMYTDIHASPEVEFATFVRNHVNSEKLYSVQTLNLRCCFAGDLRILDV